VERKVSAIPARSIDAFRSVPSIVKSLNAND
jgi:hypothetical protein